MSINYVNLTLDLYDGAGDPVETGTVTLAPNATVMDSSDHIVVTQKPITVHLFGNPLPVVQIAATDNGALQPSGWGWLIQPQFPGAPPGEVYELLFSNGSQQYLSDLIPAVEGPVITTYATAAALAAEAARAEAAEAGFVSSASPHLTGTPTAPTASAGTNSTQLATTAYADTAVSVEKSRAQTAEGLLAPKASPALTGTPTAPTASALTDSTQLATTAYADTAVAAEATRATTAEGLKLAKASNLSDVASAGTARTNLGLGTAATLASSAVAQTASNLSDLASASTARTNLGLGTAATQASSAFDTAGAATAAQAAAIAASLPTLATAAASSAATLAVNTVTQVTAASNLTMTLPTPVAGALIVVERESASAGTVTVSGSIRGSAGTVVLSLAAESEMFLGTASTWDPVAGHKTLGSLDARYDAAGTATSAVAAETTRAEAAEALAAQKSANLADLASASTARGNLAAAGTGVANTFTADQYFKSGRPWVDAAAYGADPTNTADSATAINNAITAAGAGGVVYLPAGHYKIASTLNITTSGTILCGAGHTTASAAGTRLEWAGSGSPMIYISAASGVQVRSMSLNDNSNTATYGIRLGANALYGTLASLDISGISFSSGTGTAIGNNGSDNGIYDWLLEKVRVVSCYDALRILGATPNNFTLVQCEFSNNSHCGIHVQTGAGWTITGDYQNNGTYSFWLEGCTAWDIINPYLEVPSGAAAARLSPFTGGFITRGVNFSGGYYDQAASAPAYFVIMDSSGAQDVNFMGTHFGGNLSGGSTTADINNGGGTNSGSYFSCKTSSSGVLFDTIGNFQTMGGTLNSTASTVAPDGTQAAGSSILGAPADHVHPENLGWTASDQGYLVQNFDIAGATAASFSSVPAAGQLYVAKLIVRKGATPTKAAIWWIPPTGGTPANSYLGLYNSSGTLLGTGSSDITATSTATVLNGVTIGTPGALTAGAYYLGLVIGTQGSTKGGAVFANNISGAGANANLSAANYRFAATNQTGLSALPSSFTPSSNSVTVFSFWCALL